MTSIASRPFPPARNPAKRASMDPALRGKTARLEAPDELPGEWSGPVYATLGRYSKMLTPTDSGPFIAEDDGVRRPAWQAKLIIMRHDQHREDLTSALQEHVDVDYWIPHWRLTMPTRDLTSELEQRPLLSVFRFVRLSEYYVATPRCDTKFTRRTSDVFDYGQVLTYKASTSLSLVDDIDLLLEPGSGYTCMVALRRRADEHRQVVAVDDVRTHHVSRTEFMLGYYAGLSAAVEPPNFDRTWSELSFEGVSDTQELRSRLASAFPSPGGGGPPTVDLDQRAVAYVTPRGEKAATIPLAYVRSITALLSPENDDCTEVEPVLPLLTRATK